MDSDGRMPRGCNNGEGELVVGERQADRRQVMCINVACQASNTVVDMSMRCSQVQAGGLVRSCQFATRTSRCS